MRRFLRRGIVALFVQVLWSAPARAGENADAHLRAGAAHFRAGRYEEAVVEFKVARELGAGGECPWYVASALARAGRNLDALEAFEEAEASTPDAADALFLYYRGVACSESQLVVCAAASFERASEFSGPRVAQQARQLAAEAWALLGTAPPTSAIDALLDRAAQYSRKGRHLLEKVFRREAAALAARREDRWRQVEADWLLATPDAGISAP